MKKNEFRGAVPQPKETTTVKTNKAIEKAVAPPTPVFQVGDTVKVMEVKDRQWVEGPYLYTIKELDQTVMGIAARLSDGRRVMTSLLRPADLCGKRTGLKPSDPKPCKRKAGHEGTCLETEEYAAKADANPQPSGLAAKLKALKALPAPANAVPPHVIIIARAGTGKTTTLVEGLKVMRGMGSTFIPSPQQEAVWEQLKLSAKANTVCTVCFVAFNRAIARELKDRVPQGCEAKTMHGMGYGAVRRAFNLKPGDEAMNEWRTYDIIGELLKADVRELRKESPVLLKAAKELVGLCKMNLSAADEEALTKLARHYEVELEDEDTGKSYRKEVFELVPRVLERAKDVAKDGCVDYDDQIWLPIVLDLPVFKFDLLLVDEAQDLNRCQQALAKKAGRRLVLCGDPKQAIYGFAGADAESMPRMEAELKVTPAGCITLPLTVTRRCGKAIVREAQGLVPDFGAFDTNPEGMVSKARYTETPDGEEVPYEKTYMPLVQDGDMVLCRCNAPLVEQCFRFLRKGRKANIQGRDIGKGLVALIQKLEAVSVEDLVQKIGAWKERETAREQARKVPNENKLIAIADKADCLISFTEGVVTVEDVVRKVQDIFTDDKNRPGIKLSSIHRSKGLEALRVFLLEPKGATVPHPMARSQWQLDQEWNLRYVALTRAVKELVYVR